MREFDSLNDKDFLLALTEKKAQWAQLTRKLTKENARKLLHQNFLEPRRNSLHDIFKDFSRDYLKSPNRGPMRFLGWLTPKRTVWITFYNASDRIVSLPRSVAATFGVHYSVDFVVPTIDGDTLFRLPTTSHIWFEGDIETMRPQTESTIEYEDLFTGLPVDKIREGSFQLLVNYSFEEVQYLEKMTWIIRDSKF